MECFCTRVWVFTPNEHGALLTNQCSFAMSQTLQHVVMGKKGPVFGLDPFIDP
jgi:hypothetical protein